MKRLCILITVTVMLLAAHGSELLAASGTNDKPTDPSVSEQAPVIRPGMGWSTDMERYADSVCFSNDPKTGNPTGNFDFGESLTYSEVAKQLGVDVSASATIDLFSASDTMNYMNSIKDTAFSSTINFYADATWQVMVNLLGSKEDALTAVGQSFYNNKNNMFRLICGDQIITKYDEGGELVVSIVIYFNSASDKTTFTNSLGVSYGLDSVKTKISNTTSSTNIDGTIDIKGFQRGGDPQSLAGVLKDWDGQVNLSDFEDIADKIIGSLIDYASNQWSKQFDFDTTSGQCSNCSTIPRSVLLGLTLEQVGLEAGTSWVTPAVKDARNTLGQTLNHNQDLVSHLRVLFDSKYSVNPFPDVWDTGSSVYQELHNLYTHATDNVAKLLQDGLDCYTDPKGCPETLANIQKQLQPTDPATVFDAMAPIRRQVTSSLIPKNGREVEYTYTYWIYTDAASQPGPDNCQWWAAKQVREFFIYGCAYFQEPFKYEQQSISGVLDPNTEYTFEYEDWTYPSLIFLNKAFNIDDSLGEWKFITSKFYYTPEGFSVVPWTRGEDFGPTAVEYSGATDDGQTDSWSGYLNTPLWADSWCAQFPEAAFLSRFACSARFMRPGCWGSIMLCRVSISL